MIQVAMTPAQFEAAADKLKSNYGLVLSGSQGTLSKSGVTATYAYDGAELMVNILKKPFLVTTNYCESQLVKWLDLTAPSVS
jgi:hypothetical protein